MHDVILKNGIASHFFENGNLSSVERRDNKGLLNGITTIYYENGNVCQIINFEKDLIQGFLKEYYSNGGLKRKAFYLNDIQAGDFYTYDSLKGSFLNYLFYDFHNKNRDLIKWDSLGRIITDHSPAIYIDSIRIYSDSSEKIKKNKGKLMKK